MTNISIRVGDPFAQADGSSAPKPAPTPAVLEMWSKRSSKLLNVICVALSVLLTGKASCCRKRLPAVSADAGRHPNAGLRRPDRPAMPLQPQRMEARHPGRHRVGACGPPKRLGAGAMWGDHNLRRRARTVYSAQWRRRYNRHRVQRHHDRTCEGAREQSVRPNRSVPLSRKTSKFIVY